MRARAHAHTHAYLGHRQAPLSVGHRQVPRRARPAEKNQNQLRPVPILPAGGKPSACRDVSDVNLEGRLQRGIGIEIFGSTPFLLLLLLLLPTLCLFSFFARAVAKNQVRARTSAPLTGEAVVAMHSRHVDHAFATCRTPDSQTSTRAKSLTRVSASQT